MNISTNDYTNSSQTNFFTVTEGTTPSGPKSIPPFVLGCARAGRIFSSSYGDVSGASLEA